MILARLLQIPLIDAPHGRILGHARLSDIDAEYAKGRCKELVSVKN